MRFSTRIPLFWMIGFVGLMLSFHPEAQVQGVMIPELSFNKPYLTISASGEREIDPRFWSFGGDTAVNKHFIRLTTDRQSKRGHVWSKYLISRRTFSMIFTFRISGQGERMYGDGLGLWITNEQQFKQGENHGFTGEYYGFGIVFDTFVNHDHSGGHQDVTFFENDGTKTLDDLNYMQKVGCMAPGIRYNEKNAAFSPSVNMSRAKIEFQDNFVELFIDAKNTGEWTPCYKTKLNLSPDWIEKATIGITATTGALADNHDVIGLTTFNELHDIGHAALDQEVKSLTAANQETAAEGDLERLNRLKLQYEQMIEDFEHQFTSLKESTQNTINKMKSEEEEDLERIRELEQWVNGQVNERVKSTVDNVREKVGKTLERTVTETIEKSSGWKLPFFLLLVIISGAVAFVYKKYQDLKKSHLL